MLGKVLLVVSILILVSCSDQNVQIQKLAKHKSDSLFYAEIKVFDSLADSLCLIYKSNMKQIFIDSLIQQRKVEIEKIHQQ
ncbi:MAG TPA: hypothetical protein PK006_01060 [Saprospiraceae bacterium]|nr:hypothetical protein [Saprospiraceae bacterium]